ncbi:hypothetical protein D3C75_932890 [compost metagenome]
MRVCGCDNCVIQVKWAIGTHGRCRAHRPHDHNRLIAFDGEIQEIGGLLQRVGTVSDHETIGFGTVRINFLDQLEPDFVIHILRTDVDHLLALHVGNLFQLRHRIHQRLYTQFTRSVVRLGGRVAAASDSTAGGQQGDIR